MHEKDIFDLAVFLKYERIINGLKQMKNKNIIINNINNFQINNEAFTNFCEGFQYF